MSIRQWLEEDGYRTWDGRDVSREPPFGVTVVVWRRVGARIEYLLLHRAHEGPDYAGEWAWGPPAGARFPGEDVERCARRELVEEAGLQLDCVPTACGDEEWAVFYAEARDSEPIALSGEHDAQVWLAADEARSRCVPTLVGDQIACVAALVAKG